MFNFRSVQWFVAISRIWSRTCLHSYLLSFSFSSLPFFFFKFSLCLFHRSFDEWEDRRKCRKFIKKNPIYINPNNNITLKLIQITIAQKTLSISSSNNLKRSMQRSFNNIISTAVSIQSLANQTRPAINFQRILIFARS